MEKTLKGWIWIGVADSSLKRKWIYYSGRYGYVCGDEKEAIWWGGKKIKTGDQVTGMFYKIGADLAGVQVPTSMFEVRQPAVKALIVNHDQNIKNEENAEKKFETAEKKEKKCVIF